VKRAPVRSFAFLALLAATGCASAEEAQRGARERVGGELELRLGLAPGEGLPAADEAGLRDAARAILSAPLTEESALRVALLSHRGLRARMQGLGVPAAELAQAGRLPNPLLSASARFFDAGTEFDFGLTQPILDLFYRPLRQRIAGAELAAAEARVAAGLIAHAFALRRALVRLQAEREDLSLLTAESEAAAAALALMQDLHQAGNVTDRQLVAVSAELARSQAELAGASGSWRARRESLNALLGLHGADGEAWTVAAEASWIGGDPELDLRADELEGRALRASLDLAAARSRIEAAAQRAGLADWSGLFPAGAIGVSVERDADSGEWAFGPSVAVALPLLDAGGARSAAALAAFLRELDDAEQRAVEVRAAARSLRERLDGASARARILREEHVPLSARLTLEVLREFDGMQIGAFEVIEAKQRELAARRALLAAARDARLALLDLEELLAGHLQPEFLSQPS